MFVCATRFFSEYRTDVFLLVLIGALGERRLNHLLSDTRSVERVFSASILREFQAFTDYGFRFRRDCSDCNVPPSLMLNSPVARLVKSDSSVMPRLE